MLNGIMNNLTCSHEIGDENIEREISISTKEHDEKDKKRNLIRLASNLHSNFNIYL